MYTVQGKPARAQAAAAATPCCPAPVSATTRLAPSRRARCAWPSALLILWAPVWARSSRLIHTSAPQAFDKPRARVSGVGRPIHSRRSSSNAPIARSSAKNSRALRSRRESAGISVSGAKRAAERPEAAIGVRQASAQQRSQ